MVIIKKCYLSLQRLTIDQRFRALALLADDGSTVTTGVGEKALSRGSLDERSLLLGSKPNSPLTTPQVWLLAHLCCSSCTWYPHYSVSAILCESFTNLQFSLWMLLSVELLVSAVVNADAIISAVVSKMRASSHILRWSFLQDEMIVFEYKNTKWNRLASKLSFRLLSQMCYLCFTAVLVVTVVQVRHLDMLVSK